MTLLRSVARPLLASMFFYGGVNSILNAKSMAPKAQPVADLLHQMAPDVDVSPATLVRANGALHVAAASAVATGHVPRLSSFILAGSLVPTTAMGHQFWNESDPVARQNQRIHFLKNLSMMGGLLMATLDPDPHKKFIVRRAKDKVVEAKDKVAEEIDQLRS
ncbi:MAG: DoxX family protein [Aeromicrobium sp.]